MNKERLTKLMEKLSTLEDTDDKFNMRFYFKDGCGSPSCIAGWTLSLFMKENELNEIKHSGLLVRFKASEILGLDWTLSSVLFTPPSPRDSSKFLSYDSIRPKDAVKAIQNVLDGERTVTKVWSHCLVPIVNKE